MACFLVYIRVRIFVIKIGKLIMANREVKLSVGAINITMHPHSPEQYVKLLKDAQRLKIISNIGNKRSALITAVNYFHLGDKHADAPVTGDIVKFTDIDLDGTWFDITTSKIAEESDIDSIQIPAHLKPNTQRFSFIFFPKTHLLFYEAYYYGNKFSPTAAVNTFEKILNNPKLQLKYGEIEVTHIPETDALAAALKTKHIRFLKLKVTRPNADHFSEIERKFLASMTKRNVAEIIEEHRSVKGQSLELDAQTKQKAMIAEHNGYVEIKGRDSNQKVVEFSTLSHPLIEDHYYNADEEQPLHVLHKVANMLVKKIKRK